MTCAQCRHPLSEHSVDGMGGYCLRILTDAETGEPDNPGQSCGCEGYEEPADDADDGG